MLPGVELARRRRVHYRGDAASSSSSAAAGEHHHHHHYHLHADAHRAGAAAAVAGPALAARARLEEKLRGAALPPVASPSRWSRLMGEREGRAASGGRRGRRDNQQHQAGELRAPPPAAPASSTPTGGGRRAELTRTLSMADVCAVCLDEVREERRQRVTRLPCSHKYHSECVLPWLAAHPDCPCCRALVPAAAALA